MLWERKHNMSDQSNHKTTSEEPGKEQKPGEPWEKQKPGEPWEKGKKPELTPAQAKKKRETTIMIVMIVCAVLTVLVTAGVLLYNRWVKKPELPGPKPAQTADPAISLPPGVDPTGEPTLDIEAIQPKVGGERRSEDIYTILIFGSDTTSGLTDTMMVATYDVTNQKATVVSLPRDTLINSSARPNISAKKLNAVYNVYGQGERGIEALRNEVSELVGFAPDYYVQINWELVGEMVDAIGGVWFDVPRHMEYYDPYQDLNIYQEKGYRLLDGDDAMQIVRFRHSNDGSAISDIERLNIQHSFLKAVLKQTLQIGNITRIGQLIELFNSRVNSDLAVENMLWFGQEAVLGGLKVDDVEFCTMPHLLGVYGQESFVYPIQSQLLTLINGSLNPFVEQVTIRQLDLMSVAPNGGLRSSTGRLAEPSLANPPVVNTPAPVESDPPASEPVESDPPESGPPASEEPTGSPVESTPVESGPPEEDPAASSPEPTPAETRPAWLDPAEDSGNVTDWGETPD